MYNSNQKKHAFYKEDSKKDTEHYLLFINKKVVAGLTLIKEVGYNKYQIRWNQNLEKTINNKCINNWWQLI